jgi:CheY-like chemotaxis protein
MKRMKRASGETASAILAPHASGRNMVMPTPTIVASKPVPAALRMVLVEDSEAAAELIEQTLIDSGLSVSVSVVDTQKEFEAALGHQAPSLILSDYWLPDFDGSVALEIGKLLAPDVPFIFVTGVLGEEVVIEMLKKGASQSRRRRTRGVRKSFGVRTTSLGRSPGTSALFGRRREPGLRGKSTTSSARH